MHNMIETAKCYGPQRDRNNGTRPALMMTMYDEQNIWARLSERDKTLATFLASGLDVAMAARLSDATEAYVLERLADPEFSVILDRHVAAGHDVTAAMHVAGQLRNRLPDTPIRRRQSADNGRAHRWENGSAKALALLIGILCGICVYRLTQPSG